MFVTNILFLAGSLALLSCVDASIVIMEDSMEFAADVYECIEAVDWKKHCEYRDFTAGSCRPWRLEACGEPYVQHRLSPCPSYSCEVGLFF